MNTYYLIKKISLRITVNLQITFINILKRCIWVQILSSKVY